MKRLRLPFALYIVVLVWVLVVGFQQYQQKPAIAQQPTSTPRLTATPEPTRQCISTDTPEPTRRGANNLRFEATPETSHGLRWNGIVGNGIEYELQSRYWVNTTTSWTPWIFLRKSGRVSYAHTDLVPGTKYQYRVRAMKCDQQIGDYSNWLTRTMPSETP